MYYYWWLIAILLYLFILSLYVVLIYIVSDSTSEAKSADAVFFAIASVVTLTVLPLVRMNVYGGEV